MVESFQAGVGHDLQHLLSTINEKSQAVGLGLNTNKTVTLVISKKQETSKCNIRLKTLYYSKWKSSNILDSS